MTDALYIAGTLGFFALMLAFVAACARLGRTHQDEESTHESR